MSAREAARFRVRWGHRLSATTSATSARRDLRTEVRRRPTPHSSVSPIQRKHLCAQRLSRGSPAKKWRWGEPASRRQRVSVANRVGWRGTPPGSRATTTRQTPLASDTIDEHRRPFPRADRGLARVGAVAARTKERFFSCRKKKKKGTHRRLHLYSNLPPPSAGLAGTPLYRITKPRRVPWPSARVCPPNPVWRPLRTMNHTQGS